MRFIIDLRPFWSFLKKKKNYFWLCWAFVVASRAFLQLRRVGATLQLSVQASHFSVFSFAEHEL